MLKRFAETLGVFTVMVLMIGIVGQSIYYLRFDVPIKNFISLSEIGISVSDDLILLATIFAFLTVLVWVLPSSGFRWNTKVEEAKKHLENTPEEKTRLYYINLFFILLSFSLFVCLGLLLAKDYIMKISIIVMGLFTIIQTLALSTKVIKSLTKLQANIIAIGLLYLLVYVGKVTYQIKKVELGKYIGTTITTADSVYVSTKQNYYIGKTEKYYFIYNVKDSSSEIIPAETVKKFHLKQNEIIK